jgi:hypothetical protein
MNAPNGRDSEQSPSDGAAASSGLSRRPHPSAFGHAWASRLDDV